MLLLDETPYYEPKDVLQAAPTSTPKAAGMAVLKFPVDVVAAGLLIAGGVESLATGGESTAIFELYDEEIRPIQDHLTPEPGSVTTAGRFISGIAGFVPALALGPAGVPVLAGQSAINTGAELVEQGVDPVTATQTAVLTGAAGTAMAGIPAAGKTWGKTLALAATNPLIGGFSEEATKELLQAKGYEQVAQGFDPLDPAGRGIDAVMGLAFGAMGKYAMARQQMLTRTKDGIDTVANWQRMFKDTPFDVADPKTADLGYQAMQKALADISAGKPVDLSGVLPDAPKLQRPDAPIRAEAKEAKAKIAESLAEDAKLQERRGQFDDDVVLREVLEATPREEIHEMLLTDPVSGARTRTAYEILQRENPAGMIGISDARGLGAIDKHLGHKAGDDFTRLIVKAHQEEGVPVYRASEKGDEFVTRWNGWTKEAAYAKLEAVNERLRKSVLRVENPDGSKRYFTNLELYMGLGEGKEGYNEAGHVVGEKKRTSQPAGYVKGEFPRHLAELSQERGLAAIRSESDVAPGAPRPGSPKGLERTLARKAPARVAPAEAAPAAKPRDILIDDPAAQRVEARLAQEGDFPVQTGTDALGAPISESALAFIDQAKAEYKALEAQQDIYQRISDCL